MYAVVMFLKTLWDSHGGFYFRSRFLCFKQPIKKIRINSKTLCPQSPSFLVPRPQSAKRSEKGYGDENVPYHSRRDLGRDKKCCDNIRAKRGRRGLHETKVDNELGRNQEHINVLLAKLRRRTERGELGRDKNGAII